MARIVGIVCVAAFWIGIFMVSPLPLAIWVATVAVAVAFVYAVGLVVTGDWDCWRLLL